MKSARETALLILYKTEFEGAYPNLELKTGLPSQMEQRDKSFVTALVYGVISKRLTLDYIIEQHSKIKLKKLSKYIHLILRMGLYQIFFMDKIPQSAAVNESVKLARRYGHGASAGFVNGLLRNAAKSEIKYPKDRLEYLSVKYSFPIWLCEKWVSDFGYKFTEEMLIAFDKEPELILRPNTLKTTVKDLAQELNKRGIELKIEENAIYCHNLNVGADDLYKNGMYTVQDKAAMTAAEVLMPNEGETVIDMCAAPGGKTTHMAEMMQNKGKILAFDIHEHKIKLIEENAKRLGIDIITAKVCDAFEFNSELEGIADKILCDVPCSGLGIIRRKPDIKWHRSCDDNFSQIQYGILNNASKYLKNKGQILYSTCTIEREENEEVIQKFLDENKDFTKIYEKTFYPHIDGTDGFYICKLEKND